MNYSTYRIYLKTELRRTVSRIYLDTEQSDPFVNPNEVAIPRALLSEIEVFFGELHCQNTLRKGILQFFSSLVSGYEFPTARLQKAGSLARDLSRIRKARAHPVRESARLIEREIWCSQVKR